MGIVQQHSDRIIATVIRIVGPILAVVNNMDFRPPFDILIHLILKYRYLTMFPRIRGPEKMIGKCPPPFIFPLVFRNNIDTV